MSIGNTNNITLRDANGDPIEVIDLTEDEIIDLTGSDDEDSVMTEVIANTPNAPQLRRYGARALTVLIDYVQRNLSTLQNLVNETELAHREAITALITDMSDNIHIFENEEVVQDLFNILPRRRLFTMEEEEEEDNENTN